MLEGRQGSVAVVPPVRIGHVVARGRGGIGEGEGEREETETESEGEMGRKEGRKRKEGGLVGLIRDGGERSEVSEAEVKCAQILFFGSVEETCVSESLPLPLLLLFFPLFSVASVTPSLPLSLSLFIFCFSKSNGFCYGFNFYFILFC